jgi:hypothetical protein
MINKVIDAYIASCTKDRMFPKYAQEDDGILRCNAIFAHTRCPHVIEGELEYMCGFYNRDDSNDNR